MSIHLMADFGSVLTDILNEHDVGNAEIGRMAGVSPSMVSHWTASRNVPNPQQIFAIERGLGLAPGELSRYLGYLPLEARDHQGMPSLRQVLEADPKLGLDPSLQRMVLAVYKAACNLAVNLNR